MNVTKISNVKLFTHVGNVRRHIKTVNEGHKDFKCKSCEKSFTSAGSVRGHIKNIHKGHKHFNFSNVTHVENF